MTPQTEQYASTCRDKARTVEPVLKAFEISSRRYRAQAGAAVRRAGGNQDIIATADMPTTNGSPVYRIAFPDADAWVVERLRNLGATISQNCFDGICLAPPRPTVNPWNQKTHAGRFVIRFRGSAVAAEYKFRWRWAPKRWARSSGRLRSTVSLASASFGAIPRTGVLHPLSPSLDHVRILSRAVLMT